MLYYINKISAATKESDHVSQGLGFSVNNSPSPVPVVMEVDREL